MDDWVYLYASHLNPWSYKFSYVLKASNKWSFSVRPAISELNDKKEVWGRSGGMIFEIK